MQQKIRLGILFGGQSAEHEVSIISARNVYEALDKEKYEIVLIDIDKKGVWHLPPVEEFLISSKNVATASLPALSSSLQVLPYYSEQQVRLLDTSEQIGHLDVIFPLLHGTNGEDGTIQGLLKLMDVPFVGASVLGSAIGMDKDVTKRLLRDAGVSISKFLVFRRLQRESIDFESVISELGLPFFVKPANSGSSIGVNKVGTKDEFDEAISEAFKYDQKILVEQAIMGREIECAVLGNDDKVASVPGEIIPSHEFYDYEAKYIDEKGAKLQIPANLSKSVAQKVKHMAVKVCDILCIDAMARVDFFVNKKDEIFVNEVNTIPGFTTISMYPKLWEASGLSYSGLLDRLIQLALEKSS